MLRLNIRINDCDETWKYERMQVAEYRLALPCPALQWHQCDSECIFVTLEMHLTTLFSEIFCFSDFFVTGQDGTDTRNRDRQTFLGKYYLRYMKFFERITKAYIPCPFIE